MSALSRSLTTTLLLAATTAFAQESMACSAGPGAAFGIGSYQCANCVFKSRTGGRSTYSFYAEPVILQTDGAGGAHIGDIVEAVNGKPITTILGADNFTYPRAGANEITVRRGRDRHVLKFTIPTGSECSGPLQLRLQPSPGPRVAPERATQEQRPLMIVDGVVVDPPLIEFGPTNQTGRYGFAVACAQSCTATEGREGTTRFTYYRYDEYPPIIAVRSNSPADRAGMRVGDVITKVDGQSVLEQEGALRLGSIFSKEVLRLTILRDGKEAEYAIRMP